MPTVTIEQIQAKQSELSQLIQKLQAQAAQASTSIEIEERVIDLTPGEHYAGAVLDAGGQHMHHLVLLAARPAADLNWQQAGDWASRAGGDLPTRQEQALLYANCKSHLKAGWHWSSEAHESDASYAWICYFYDGLQNCYDKSFEGGAVAVRRV